MSPPAAGLLAGPCAPVALFTEASGVSGEALEAMRNGGVAASSITVWELTRQAVWGGLPPLPTRDGLLAAHEAGTAW